MMILYLTQVTFLWLTFGIIYYFLLRNKTMYGFNRWYLLVTFLGSLFLPLVPFGSIFPTSEIIPVFVLAENQLNDLVINTSEIEHATDWQALLKIIIITGMAFFALRFMVNLAKVLKLIRQSEKVIYEGIIICITDDKDQVFSFGNTIFMSKNMFDNIEDNQDVWLHEKAHIQQFHTLDIVLTESCKILFWFHPLVYLYEQYIRINHEYQADEVVLKQTSDIKAYQHKLLNCIENKTNYLTSNFNFNLTKKRFIMMKTKTNPQAKMMAKLLAVFGMAATVTFVACSDKKEKSEVPYVYIDAQAFDEPVENVDVKAIPPSGEQAFRNNIAKKLQISEALEADVSFIFRFIVEKDGSLSNFEVEGAVDETHHQLSQQVIDLMKAEGDWKPAEHQGEIVRSPFFWRLTLQLK